MFWGRMGECWLLTPFACFPFTSPPVRHRVPSGFNWAIVMLDTPCSEVVWRVLAIHSIRQFLLHFPSRASPCAITFQLDSTIRELSRNKQSKYPTLSPTLASPVFVQNVWSPSKRRGAASGAPCRAGLQLPTSLVNTPSSRLAYRRVQLQLVPYKSAPFTKAMTSRKAISFHKHVSRQECIAVTSHATSTHRGNRGLPPPILIHHTRSRWEVNTTSRVLYPLERTPVPIE
jgi:hypothetical protein